MKTTLVAYAVAVALYVFWLAVLHPPLWLVFVCSATSTALLLERRHGVARRGDDR